MGGDENFPISEANRLLPPSLADVRGWLLLFDGANLNIPPVPLDSCLLLSKCDNMEKEDCFHILWHPIMTFRGEKKLYVPNSFILFIFAEQRAFYWSLVMLNTEETAPFKPIVILLHCYKAKEKKAFV